MVSDVVDVWCLDCKSIRIWFERLYPKHFTDIIKTDRRKVDFSRQFIAWKFKSLCSIGSNSEVLWNYLKLAVMNRESGRTNDVSLVFNTWNSETQNIGCKADWRTLYCWVRLHICLNRCLPDPKVSKIGGRVEIYVVWIVRGKQLGSGAVYCESKLLFSTVVVSVCRKCILLGNSVVESILKQASDRVASKSLKVFYWKWHTRDTCWNTRVNHCQF